MDNLTIRGYPQVIHRLSTGLSTMVNHTNLYLPPIYALTPICLHSIEKDRSGVALDHSSLNGGIAKDRFHCGSRGPAAGAGPLSWGKETFVPCFEGFRPGQVSTFLPGDPSNRLPGRVGTRDRISLSAPERGIVGTYPGHVGQFLYPVG